MKNTNFNNFTNLFSLTKTLKFELKPVLGTRPLTEIIKEDREIDRLYNTEMKPMIDNLHEKFINESLSDTKISKELIEKIECLLVKIRKNKKENKNSDYKKENEIKKEIEKIQEKLRESIVNSFDSKGEKWKKYYSDIKLKNQGFKILFENKMLLILKEIYPDKKDIIDKFKGFFTYFIGFNKNKENYYSSESKDTAISNRIIDENLIRFLDNRHRFQEIQTKTNIIDSFGDYFKTENYEKYLTENGINKFNEAIGKINKDINLFRQQNKDVFSKIPKLNILYKQIGCDRGKSFIFSIEEGEEWKKIEEFYEHKNINRKYNQKEILSKVRDGYLRFFQNINNYDLDKIYFNKASINTISSFWFTNWHKLSELLAAKKIIKNKDKEGQYTIPEKISLADIKNVLEIETNIENLFKNGKCTEEFPEGEYAQFFSNGNAWKIFIQIWKYEIHKDFRNIDKSIDNFINIKKKSFSDIDKIERVRFIKEYCDAFLSIERIVKYHKVKEENEKDNEFYDFIDIYLNGTILNQYYNAFRNYLTQKPFNQDKIKLNFNSPMLASGFDLNKEPDNLSVILKNEGIFYLAIINKNNNKCFDKKRNKKLYENSSSEWEKLEYKYFPDASKMIPHCSTQTKAVLSHFNGSSQDYEIKGSNFSKTLTISKRIFDLNNITYNKEKIEEVATDKKKGLKMFQKEYLMISKNNVVYKKALIDWINFCKDFLNSYKDCGYFDYSKLKDSKNYESLDKFYQDVDSVSYSAKFTSINKDELLEMVEDGQIYLFKIYNKDFAEKKKGRDNLETMILKNLFSSNKIKLNGGAEIFFRNKSIEAVIDKKRSEKMKIKVIENKRYSEDKYFFHFPVTINFSSPEVNNKEFNLNLNKAIIKNDFNILGIDRGEKNLLYYFLIDKKGNPSKQGSLNICKGKDYNKLLTDRAKEMKGARQSWEQIGKIKDLKEGYLSQAIHEIYNLAINNNAIVVLEDLNSQFKAKRTAKVEKSVYKKFELALARKLSHLILKERSPEEVGGVLNAYQLTPLVGPGDVSRFESQKQWGIMFYVRPDYTSAIDPLTGWRKTRYISNSENYPKIRASFNPTEKNFIKIDYDKEKQCFKFNCDKWNLFAHTKLERFYWNRTEKNIDGGFGTTKKYSLYECFDSLFKDLKKDENINSQIISSWSEKDSKWKSLIFYWNLLNQIRNTDTSKEGDENDFIQSPIYSDKIKGFFDSRKKYDNVTYPNNGDANGAYNIARKGLMLLERIKNNPEKPDLFIRNEEWDSFAQNN